MNGPLTLSTNPLWIDAEVHVLPPEWCNRDYYPAMSENVMRRVVYDHPERAEALRGATYEALRESLAACGLDGAVLLGMPWKDDDMNWRNNAYIADVLKKGDPHIYAMGLLPAPGADLRDAVKRIGDMGFRGVKVIPSWQDYVLDDAVLEPALDEMEKGGLILYPHTDQAYLPPAGRDPPHALLAVARRHPNLKILAPHLGGLLALYALHAPVSAALKNILFIASLPTTMRMTLYAVDAIGADRIAFGTDFPFNPAHDQAAICRAFEALPLENAARDAIKGQNLVDFLNAVP
jgi:predicted TIM-barrel fold metal-dependent hydrolase